MLRPHHGEEFCVIHGREHMVEEFGNPIPYCAKCEEEREAPLDAEPFTYAEHFAETMGQDD